MVNLEQETLTDLTLRDLFATPSVVITPRTGNDGCKLFEYDGSDPVIREILTSARQSRPPADK